MRDLVTSCLLVLALVAAPAAGAAQVKDIARIDGVRDNQLAGVGLVVGLNGTGDSTPVLAQALANALTRAGVRVSPDQARAKNAAVVYVTASLPPFARPGGTIDVTVSSLGDARSLVGGTLLRAPLEGADGQVYAVAQGSLLVVGLAAGGDGASVQKNHPTVGRIPGGALVERGVPGAPLADGNELRLVLREPSFATADRLARAVTERLPLAAVAEDSATVCVVVPDEALRRGDLVGLIARLGELEVEPDVPARVVLDERTGTVVVGERVRLARVAISHGALTITVTETPLVSQPGPRGRGETEVVPRTEVTAREASPGLHVVDPGATVADLARALNALGVTPRELVAIFQALKTAGALHAELVVQ